MYQYREKPPARPGASGSNGKGVSHSTHLEDTSFSSHTTSARQSQQVQDRPVFTTYDYIDADGVLLYQNVRVQDSGGKHFFQRRPDECGGWVRGLGKPRMVAHLPYRLPDLLGEPPDQVVVLHEGEKAADAAARSLPGFVHMATGGALSKVRHYAHYFEGRVVAIIQDNDMAGCRQACLAADCLQTQGAKSVRILRLPDLPDKGDCFDWIAAGGTSKALCDLIEATPPYAGHVPPAVRPEPSADESPSHGNLDDLLVEQARSTDVLSLIAKDTTLRKIAHHEHAGPCPFCGGRDRLHVNVEKNAWFCRKCVGEPMPGQPWQDPIAYVMRRERLDFVKAVHWLSGAPQPTGSVRHAPETPGRSPVNDSHEVWRFLDLAQVRELPPVEHLIEGKIPENGTTVIFGPPNVGKSFYALDIGLRLSADRPVFYLAGEGRNGYAERVRAWETHHGRQGGRFFLSENGLPSLLDERHVDELLVALAGFERPVLIVDTLAYALAGGDENSTRDMMLLLAQLNRLRHETGATLLLVHHSNKAGTGERGSSALRGGVDSLIEITGGDGYFSVSCVKSKDARPFDDEHYRLIPVATRGERTSMVVVLADRVVQTRQDELSPNQQRLLETLLLETFREAGCRASILQEQSRVPVGSLYRTLSGLMALGYVRQDSRGEPYFITGEGIARIAPAHPAINHHAADDGDSDSDRRPAQPSIIAITTLQGDSGDSEGQPNTESPSKGEGQGPEQIAHEETLKSHCRAGTRWRCEDLN